MPQGDTAEMSQEGQRVEEMIKGREINAEKSTRCFYEMHLPFLMVVERHPIMSYHFNTISYYYTTFSPKEKVSPLKTDTVHVLSV